MAGFKQIIARLKVEERKILSQLSGIRRAIESLEFGSSVSPSIGPAPTARGRSGVANVRRRKRKFSAATRRKMAIAQKARWARLKAKA
jgi:hypothetical protein